MIQPSDIEKLKRFSEGLSDVEEIRYIYSLFSGKEDSPQLKNYFMKEWNSYSKSNEIEEFNLDYLLDRIHRVIYLTEYKKEQTLTRKIYRWYSVVAAVLLIPLLIAGGLLFFGKYEQEKVFVAENPVSTIIHAPLGSRINFTLPDGTEGWLNSGSSLDYKIPFSNNREITLQGEAWFDVAEDILHPFEITAGNSKVRVLGTKFNLNAYPDENYTEIVLVEGKVEFDSPRISEAIEMKPNERLVYKNNSVIIDNTDPLKYSGWVEGKLIFRGDPMPEVARRIARWYNVEVELADVDLEKDVFRGTFQDDSLEEVLHYISMASPIRYRIIDRKVLADGTFQKKKVLLYRKKI